MRWCVVVWLWASPLLAAVPIQGAERPIPANSFAVLTASTSVKESVLWDVSPQPTRAEQIGSAFVLSGPSGGVYKVTVTVIDFDAKKVDRGYAVVTISGTPGPGPDPGPTPVPPTPAPEGFRVIWVYESSAGMTREQGNILNSTRIAAYLNGKATVGADGRPSWRHWDKDVVYNEKDPVLKELWESVKPKITTVPVVVIARGGKAEIFAIPATEEITLALITKFAEGR